MNKIYQHIFRYALIITNKNISLLHTDINIICSLQSNSIFNTRHIYLFIVFLPV